MHELLHCLEHSLLDCLKQLPLLFLSYLIVEYAEHKMSSKMRDVIYRAGKAGPLLGSLVGVIPQCGFAAAAAGLFAGGVISPGTLIAVFLSTSDEMLPIMVSGGIHTGTIITILAAKVAAGTAAGLIVDFAAERIMGPRGHVPEHVDMCEHEHCGCENHSIVYSALHHTLHVAIFLFVISFVLALGMEWAQGGGLLKQLASVPVITEAAAGLVGMIPNCAASVLITQLYLSEVIPSGALFAGLLCGAGTGLLVLYRVNHSQKMNLALTAVLYVSGVLFGVLLGAVGIL